MTASPERAPALTVAAVARRLGVAPATLRTWDRRYGIGPTGHTAGRHRRYSAADVVRLQAMRRLTLQGVAPGDAARLAQSVQTSPSLAHAPVDDDGRGRGGVVLPVRDVGPKVRGLARAAMALDGPAAAEICAAHVSAHGVVASWENLICPVLIGAGERWATTGAGVDVEHLLSEVVLTTLRPRALGSVAQESNGHSAGVADLRPVLLACAEGEGHALPVHALAAALQERAVPVRVLGARVPMAALASAIRRSGPSVVFVWARQAQYGDLEPLRALPRTRPSYRLLFGGPGWAASADAATSLADALARILDDYP